MTVGTSARAHGRTVWSRALAGVVPLCVCASVPAWPQCPDGTPPPCAPRLARAAAPAPTSVAVLYFDNLSRDSGDAYLAEGITEEIISRLGDVARLTVKSRYAVRRYRAGAAASDPAAIGRTLAVAYLVTGSVRRAGNRIRISVELLRARDGVQLWADAYNRTDADVLAIEEEIARAVATAIAGRLLPQERAALAARPTGNPEAHDRVLRGNFFLARRTQQDAARAIAEYEAAIRLDPGYADAYGYLGYAYALAHNWSWSFPGLTPESLLARADAAARRGLALDSASAAAWSASALVRMERSEITLEGAVPSFRRAIALDPRRPDPHHQLGIALALLGSDSAGVASLQQALALDPERPITLTWLGIVMMHQRRYADARRWLDSALAVSPAFPYALSLRGAVRVYQGDTAGALQDAREAVRTSRGDTLLAVAVLGWTEAASRDTAAAGLHARSVAAAPGRIIEEASAWAAATLLVLGDRSGALATLEHSTHNAFLRYHLDLEHFDPLRAEPRFERLVEALRIPGAPK